MVSPILTCTAHHLSYLFPFISKFPSLLPFLPMWTTGPLHSIISHANILNAWQNSNAGCCLPAFSGEGEGLQDGIRGWVAILSAQLHVGLKHILHYFLQSALCPVLSTVSSIDYANSNPVSAGDMTLCHQRKATEANILRTAQAYYRFVPEPGNFSFTSAAMAASPPPLHWILCLGLPTHHGIQ